MEKVFEFIKKMIMINNLKKTKLENRKIKENQKARKKTKKKNFFIKSKKSN